MLSGQLCENLMTGLLLAVGHQYRDALVHRRPALAAPSAVRRVVEVMRAQPARPYTVVELAAIARVSPNWLQQSFRRYVGVSPMAYLRELRLSRVHDELREADPTRTTVAEVAFRYGFTHPSRFAATYRRRYGVSPSQTLRH